MKISRRSQTAPFIAMDVLAEAGRAEAAGRHVIHMEVGEPAHGAPMAAREAVARAIRDGAGLGYTSGLGLPRLREAIAGLYAARHGVAVDPARVVVTAGSSAGFVLSFLALFDAGARVAIADPGYPCYRNILQALDVVPVRLAAGPATRFQPTPALLAGAGPLDGLLVASPANPTGTMIDRAEMAALIGFCEGAGASLISDEIYHGITYDAPAVSALELTGEVVVINSFSKYHAMTGWRVGWMVVPEGLLRTVQNLAQNLFICPPHLGQIAALGALSPEGEAEVAGHLAHYRANRAALIPALERMGFRDIAPADGAFYAYARLPEGWGDSREFCAQLLAEHGVAATPGLDFDPERGAGTVRFSFARSTAEIEEGIDRLSRMIADGPRRGMAAARAG
ncbi:aminotransferase class I/II-fold pyridoxal phosphate-dependent enzyme [Limibaculum sp. FT325]|uniref:pyridoxal phosphate-dependent aminotransferase n=1 Tax=Thermohalobaculum sediminis TaxID=2939436 RepID=UPI0020C05188|nr:aminotransferase class I/II-fold pyridoxal phosphate-dependent enzyme [Limibaculum sediminis]MCL5778730.1 aminotransferase class I/II-fold pyridoxal phosphate-dependent enzyme [Limibaculum sediminis]